MPHQFIFPFFSSRKKECVNNRCHYITKGDVRGCCNHKHISLKVAKRCVENDHIGCKSQGGYSDREIYKVNNKTGKIVARIDFETLEEIE